MEITTTKKIIFEPNPTTTTKKKIEKKEKRKRIITETNKWNNYFVNKETDFNKDVQLQLLSSLSSLKNSDNKSLGSDNKSLGSDNKSLGSDNKSLGSDNKSLEEDKKIHFLREQIRQKIHNYHAQDMKKQLYNPENFITLEFILEKLKDCNLDCFYCREPVFIWYEIAREPKQWTVERIDNKIGHDIGNIEIACLSCNLKRRCMYHERYVFTKQMKIVKTESNVENN